MVNKHGASTPSVGRPLNYFFLDGYLDDDGSVVPLLHKKLHINRGKDTITTWCYPLHKRVAYTYTHVKREMAPAFTTVEAATMLNRRRITLERAILNGDIESPQFTYGLDENKNKFKYMWHEKNILEMHAFLSTQHYGRPRKDGLITPQKLPTTRELRAIIRQSDILYVKVGDEFKPVWQAEDFT